MKSSFLLNCSGIWSRKFSSLIKEGVIIKSLSIRINEEMLHKLHVVADYEGRSANSQILVLIRSSIEAYEEKHGKIKL